MYKKQLLLLLIWVPVWLCGYSLIVMDHEFIGGALIGSYVGYLISIIE